MTTTTDITALIDKQLEGVDRRLINTCCCCNFAASYTCMACDLKAERKIIGQYQRLGKWVQHDPKCHSHELIRFIANGPLIKGKCDCGLSAELDAIQKELEG